MSYNNGNNGRRKRGGKTVALKVSKKHKNRRNFWSPPPDHMDCTLGNLRKS